MKHKPELIMLYEMYDYPVGGRCSACRENMPQSSMWINPVADNLIWLRNQFELHLTQRHHGDCIFPDSMN